MTTIREELWKTKGILFNFAIFDLKVKYRNSVLGILWSLIEPLLLLGVFFVVFSTIFKFEIENFVLYLLLGLITWNFFKNGTSLALGSITNRAAFVSQIYFPRAIPGLSAGVTAALLLLTELVIFAVFMVAHNFIPSLTIIYLIPIFLLELILIMGIALPLSVLNAKFKDVEFIWGVVLQAGFFLTPIFYQFDMLPETVRNVLQFSPMVQIVTMAHHVTLYGELPSVNSMLYAIFSVGITVIVGYLIFRKFQTKIVEDM
jgi:lipopolysaccharide transport system permease protein